MEVAFWPAFEGEDFFFGANKKNGLGMGMSGWLHGEEMIVFFEGISLVFFFGLMCVL